VTDGDPTFQSLKHLESPDSCERDSHEPGGNAIVSLAICLEGGKKVAVDATRAGDAVVQERPVHTT
jgi:hypothetical protein